MPSTKDVINIAVIVLVYLCFGGLASPTGISHYSPLGPRHLVRITGCSADHKAKLEKGFEDVVELAKEAVQSITSKDHVAFRHYFRTNGAGSDEDFAHATSLWSALARNEEQINVPYEFSVSCAPPGDPVCHIDNSRSFAWTESRPQQGNTPRQITICPLYFLHPATTKHIDSHKWKQNPGRRDDSWCQPGAKFRDFSIGALTLLHEMTHLDAVTALANYPVVHDPNGNFNTHATEDVGNEVPPRSNPPAQARNLAKRWQTGKNTQDLMLPFRNAESIAAAALEAYVMKRCGMNEIEM